MSCQDFCNFCAPNNLLSTHIQSALFEKYSTSIHFYHLQHLEPIIHDDLSPLAVQFREMQYLTESQQCLKRLYQSQEFPNKIRQLSEYYKFSRDLPRPNDHNLTRTIQRYHDKLRQFDFKRVKAAVKRQQGISLTSCHEQQSSFRDSNCEIKSRYSSVLHALDEDHNQSDLLQQFCQQIEGAFPDSQSNSAIKGFFPEATKKFQDFVQKEEKKSKGFCFKKRKQQQNDKLNKQNTLKNGLNLIRQPSKKSVLKNLNEKTRANDTLSREQKMKKQKPFHRTIDCERLFKPLSTITLLHKHPPKTLQQIYKGNSQQSHIKYNSTKEKKLSIENKKRKSVANNQCPKPKPAVRNAMIIKQNNYVLDTDRHNKQQNKKSLTKTSIHRSIEHSKRQSSLQSQKTLPLAQMGENQRERLLTRSKSRSKIERQGSRQSMKVKPTISHTVSRFSQGVSKTRAFSRSREERARINRVLEKKLAL